MMEFFDKNFDITIKNVSPEMETLYLHVHTSDNGELIIKYIKSFEEAVKIENIVCLTKDMTLTVNFKSQPDEFHEEEQKND